MSKFTQLFKNLAHKDRPAYIPFLMLGDPTLDISLAIIEGAIKGGADALELGIPFSDPIADGPIVQQASSRALNQGATPKNCLEIVKNIRKKYPTIPIGLLVYANLVYHEGIDVFYQSAYQAGVDAVLVADAPLLEVASFVNAATQNGIDTIMLATPGCSEKDIQLISQISQGYTYVVTRKGVTGTQIKSVFDQAHLISHQLETHHAPPPVFGFGIRNADEVQQAYLAGAKGVIIGSALIQRLQELPLPSLMDANMVAQITSELFQGKSQPAC